MSEDNPTNKELGPDKADPLADRTEEMETNPADRKSAPVTANTELADKADEPAAGAPKKVLPAAELEELIETPTPTPTNANNMKSLGNTDVSKAHDNVGDLVVFGNGDIWQLLCKASSKKEGWMKSTKAMPVHHGCVVQVTTQQRNEDGSYAVAEAVAYVPGVTVKSDGKGGRMLVSA